MGKNTHPAGVSRLSRRITEEVIRRRTKLSKQVSNNFWTWKNIMLPNYSTIPVLMNLFKDNTVKLNEIVNSDEFGLRVTPWKAERILNRMNNGQIV